MGAPRGPNGDTFLFNPELLKNLDWNSVRSSLNPPISNEEPGEPWLLVRPLSIMDYSKGYVQILSQLTTVGNISKADFERQFWRMQNAGGYYVTVIEDTRSNKIIGAASLITEFKIIHSCGLRARLEDVVVNNTYRGKQLGKLIVLTVSLLSKKLGCYKMSLDCKDSLIPFYKSIGYKLEPGNANSMVVRYEETTKPQDPS
ncbi:hypothetical protein NQ318_001006 [Aromia moschata]|uniref:Glucosamine 6-phosphate N-acetyltransferase n=1 Tax=Aromia moschata TaxID=1265417 RepID=A0AAV8ZDX0_9CUCU|nr:hypothetical protein NQ318_001006 [Aromia moschata]